MQWYFISIIKRKDGKGYNSHTVPAETALRGGSGAGEGEVPGLKTE